MAVGKVVEAQSNRRNYVIAAAVGVIVILALALGLTFGLRKPGYPSAEPASLLASDNCPIFRQQVKDNETTTITGRLDVIVMDGAKTSQSYVLTTNAANERIQIIVSADREIELQEAKGMEVTVKGKKADCSLLIYNSVFGGDTDITVAGKSPSTSSLTSSASVTASSTFTKESIYTKLPTSTSSFVREIATSSLPSSLPSTSPLPPSKKIALVLFAFSNNPASTRETADQFRDRLFLGKNGQNGISPIFEKYSNGMVKFQGLKNLALSADVFGWYTLPGKDTDNCNYFDW